MKSAIIKSVLFIIFSFSLFQTIAQPANLISLSRTEKVYHGLIDVYPFTMYLELENGSEYNSNVYSVKGWYQYNNKKIKIPLVGIVSDDIVLYQTNDVEMQKRILNQPCENNFYDCLEALRNETKFIEKFVLTKGEVFSVGTWQRGSKTLKVQLENNDLYPQKNMEFLQFTIQDKTFDLQDLESWYHNYEILKDNGRGTKIILSYSYGSNSNYNGMCGAGEESGLLYLVFNAEHSLISYEFYQLESCLKSLETAVEEIENNVLVYTIQNFTDELTRQITVDLNKVEIIEN